LAVVAAIEAADVVFAVDSVPAVLAVSSDPFIVYPWVFSGIGWSDAPIGVCQTSGSVP
jgi:predicted tellurium resistance membrane protein TerC